MREIAGLLNTRRYFVSVPVLATWDRIDFENRGEPGIELGGNFFQTSGGPLVDVYATLEKIIEYYDNGFMVRAKDPKSVYDGLYEVLSILHDEKRTHGLPKLFEGLYRSIKSFTDEIYERNKNIIDKAEEPSDFYGKKKVRKLSGEKANPKSFGRALWMSSR
jgi:hypothetical protein